ncbi:hypothetical protein NFI96_026355, partial [Prochilodus magdalenae]
PVQSLHAAFCLVEPSVLCDLYSGFTGQQDQPELSTEEDGQLTVTSDHLGPVALYSIDSLINLSVSNNICCIVLPLKCPRLFLERLILQLHGGLQCSFWTLRFSYTNWYHRGKQRICVRRHYVLLRRGAVMWSWWILTNDFLKASAKTPVWYGSAARVTLAEHIDGHLTRVASGMFTEHAAYSTSGGVQVTEVSRTYQTLVIGHDEWAYCANSGSEVITAEPEPQPEPGPSPSPQPEPSPFPSPQPEAAGGSADPVAQEVPSLHAYSEINEIDNFPFKMTALREAFTLILSDAGCCEYICGSARDILGDLASLNDRDLTSFQQVYDQLLEIAQSTFCREDIEMELGEIGIQHFNFMDVVYEFVLLRIQAGEELRIRPRPMGFLDHLVTMMSFFSATTQQSRPRADQYLLQVQKAMLMFLGDIFTLEENVYEDTESLASDVWEILEKHCEDLLESLEDI